MAIHALRRWIPATLVGTALFLAACRISTLHPLVAGTAAADENIRTPPDGLAHHLVLVLRFDLLYFQRTSTVAVRG
jgi:hypothetical protein